MKKSLDVYAFGIFMLFVSLGHAATTSKAEIVSIQGQGEFREASEQRWKEAAIRQKLAEGHFVRTGDSSRMAILLTDQTQVRLAANSMLQIKQVGDNRDRGTILNQNAGRSWAQSKSIPDRLTVETPSALAAIRGTDWELVVDDDGNSTLTVLSGEVVLSNEKGQVSVGAGEQGRARRGVAPVKQRLLNPRERVQWVSSFVVDPDRYPELRSLPAHGADADKFHSIKAPIAAGDLTSARKMLETLAASASALPVARLLLADFQVQEGDFAAALNTLEAGARQFAGDERFDVWRARLHLMRDETALACSALEDAAKKRPGSVELALATGELERLEGNAPAATRAYHAALATDPASARAWHGLGVIQTEREEVADARASLAKALAIDPAGVGFRGELGTLEAFANDLPAARDAFQRALADHPDDYVALHGLGLVELKTGRTDAAITHLLAATLIEPRYARAQTTLAVAYYQQGRIRDALQTLARARALDPKDPLPDLYESLIRNDLKQPGLALNAARRAMGLLPYLKSLNQIANDQKGSANLGSALAAFGLEDWARSYAQDSYTPFWAGSHLFLADRYSGAFNKKSELMQGFLSDPTVFGASNRFSDLIARPGNHAAIGARFNTSHDAHLTEPTLTLNGYANSGLPFAYFAEAIRTQNSPGDLGLSAGANTYTLALGARPTHELGLFVYANAFTADLALNPSSFTRQHINGDNQRIDFGVHYRFGAKSQAWLKIGAGSENSTVDQITTLTTNLGQASSASYFRTRPEQNDLQFRHTFAIGGQHEISWGAEFARTHKRNLLVQETLFHIGEGSVPSDRLDQVDRGRSRNLWLSDRFHLGPSLLLQGDLHWQHYVEDRDIQIMRDRLPPLTQSFPENHARQFVAARLGAAATLGEHAVLRAAVQQWLRPAGFDSLAPIATAGIPLDDSLVLPGGRLTRSRVQFDWELAPTWFIGSFAERKNVDNLVSPLDGVLNTRTDVTNLDRLRQRDIPNLGAPDQLEGNPVFARGRASRAGLTVNHVLSNSVAGYIGYANTHSENTGPNYPGRTIPFLPEHLGLLGLTWAGDQRMVVSARAAWRSRRYLDEANLQPLPLGWDLTLKLHWESPDKRWLIETWALNLLKRSTNDLYGVSLVWRY